ncbi:MAG: insulinase family protein [Firmicutes bacterium]|nr:insulinase family protein [Bacillota bacterium]
MFKTEKIAEGVQLHSLTTTKFKTITSKAYVQTVLGEKTAMTALLPMVISRGSARFPTMQAIASHLANLYGARFGCDVAKIGERHCMEFYYEMANTTFVGNDRELLDQGMATLVELICHPRIEGNGFHPEYVEQEKVNLKNQINSLIDNKRNYALQRFYEAMFAGEPFSTYKYGTVEAVERITPEALLEHYRATRSANPIDIFVVGDFDLEAVRGKWIEGLAELRNGYQPLPCIKSGASPQQVRQVEEGGDLQQGILFLGYRTPITYSSPDYYKLLVYSGLLGGFPHSKLFINVREKASLAYYAWARLEATKGFLMLNAGIHPDNYQEAVGIILHQVEEINRGKVSVDELEATKHGLINSILTMEDNAMAVIDRGLMGVINGVRRGMNDATSAIRRVTIEDLVEQGRLMELDTIYFLRGQPLDHIARMTRSEKGANMQ